MTSASIRSSVSRSSTGAPRASTYEKPRPRRMRRKPAPPTMLLRSLTAVYFPRRQPSNVNRYDESGYSRDDGYVTASRPRPSAQAGSVSNQPRQKSNLWLIPPGGHMSEAEAHSPNRHPLGQSVEFRVAAKLENLAVVRTLVTALTTLEDLDLDAVADLRLAVDEACTRLIRCSTPDATLVIGVVPHVSELVITASAPCMDEDILRPGTFSWHVISSLTDEVTVFHNGVEVADQGRVFGITMTARRLVSNT